MCRSVELNMFGLGAARSVAGPVRRVLHIVSVPEVGARHRNAGVDLAMKEAALTLLEAAVTNIRPPFRGSDEFMTFPRKR